MGMGYGRRRGGWRGDSCTELDWFQSNYYYLRTGPGPGPTLEKRLGPGETSHSGTLIFRNAGIADR